MKTLLALLVVLSLFSFSLAADEFDDEIDSSDLTSSEYKPKEEVKDVSKDSSPAPSSKSSYSGSGDNSIRKGVFGFVFNGSSMVEFEINPSGGVSTRTGSPYLGAKYLILNWAAIEVGLRMTLDRMSVTTTLGTKDITGFIFGLDAAFIGYF